MALKFEKVSPEELTILKTKLQSNGTTVQQFPNQASNTFLIDGHNIKARATYEPTSEELIIEITHKPFYVSEHMIETAMEEFLNSNATPPAVETEVKQDDNN